VGATLVWSDNFIGDGENQLGLMLMQLRELWRPGTFPSWAAACRVGRRFRRLRVARAPPSRRFGAATRFATPQWTMPRRRRTRWPLRGMRAAIVALDVAQLAAVTDNDAAWQRCEISTAHLNRRDDLVSLDADKFRQLFAAVRRDAAADGVLLVASQRLRCASRSAPVSSARFLGFALGGGDGETRDGERVVALMRAAGVRSRFVVEPASMHTSADVRTCC
jgi:hypothetical protein